MVTNALELMFDPEDHMMRDISGVCSVLESCFAASSGICDQVLEKGANLYLTHVLKVFFNSFNVFSMFRLENVSCRLIVMT